MLYQLENLKNEEKELILNAPAYVTILIAGADDDISDAEIKRSLELVKIKTFSEPVSIREIYGEIESDFNTRLNQLILELPKTLEERENQVIDKLSGLNKIWPKMNEKDAHRYYVSLLGFATQIAKAAGGVLGFESVSPREERFVKLPMINDPKA